MKNLIRRTVWDIYRPAVNWSFILFLTIERNVNPYKTCWATFIAVVLYCYIIGVFFSTTQMPSEKRLIFVLIIIILLFSRTILPLLTSSLGFLAFWNISNNRDETELNRITSVGKLSSC